MKTYQIKDYDSTTQTLLQINKEFVLYEDIENMKNYMSNYVYEHGRQNAFINIKFVLCSDDEKITSQDILEEINKPTVGNNDVPTNLSQSSLRGLFYV